ncbi:MAG: hypothetical protein MSIBF_03500 [Candidatus Altiarchaeales archaeon IMC4]|nr:MAG: hypothetical protein MSIBF_03500 [Candidatus Altiarchaeales archaeon IMC4]
MKLSQFKTALSKVRWKSVIALLVVLAVLAVALNSFIHPDCTAKDGICINVWADPDKINVYEGSTVWVDVKNVGEEVMEVSVDLKAWDESLRFKGGDSNFVLNNDSAVVSIAPGENRRVDFAMKLVGAKNPGKYRIDVLAHSVSREVEKTLYLEVVKV